MEIQDKPNQSVGFLEPGKWFRQPASSENYKRIWISPRWTNDFKDLENRLEPDPSSIAELRRLLPMKQFSWEFVMIMPRQEPATKDLGFPNLHQSSATDIQRCYVIFLEDWRSGHYFEINNYPIVRWIAGDTVLWQQSVAQVIANVGITPLRILKITGTIDPLEHDWRLQHFNDSIF
jgi:hypothetical protein